MIRVQGLRKNYPGRNAARAVLDGVDAEFPSGVCTAVVGNNGSGKSTLLRCLVGLLPPDEGVVRYMDRPLSPATAIGIVFDGPRPLYPRLRVMEVAGYLLALLGRHTAGNVEDARRILHALGVDDVGSELQKLSRGTQQKLSIAVALAGSPAIIVCDEPTSFLDSSASAAVARELANAAVSGSCVIVATHDASLIAATGASTLRLRDGRMVSFARADEEGIDSGCYRVRFNDEVACDAGCADVGLHLRERVDGLTCIVHAAGIALLGRRFPDGSIARVEAVRWQAA